MKLHGSMAEVSAAASFCSEACDINTWIPLLQYAACFGVEFIMNNPDAVYFRDDFDQSTESAAAIDSIFGWINLFARGTGGFLSDKASASMGMCGRLIVQTILLLGEEILVLVLAITGTIGATIVVMVTFSLFMQSAEGSTYGIVPYVNPPSTRSISGIVGDGGNSGAVDFGMGTSLLLW